MADRYWVLGSGSWNSTAKWSTTSGGTGGASVPTSADNAIFDGLSGVGTAHYIVTVTDNSTCANLTFTPETAVGVTEFVVGSGFVIVGTFSTSSTAGNRRAWFRSSTYGLMRDMQIATIGSVSDVDFRDIRITGAGGTLSGTRIGDLRGNSGITFNAPKTVYWNLGGTSATLSDNAWAATSGGTPNTDNFPLAQDIAVFNNSSTVPSGNIITGTAVPYIGTIDMGSRSTAMRLQTANPIAIYGNFSFGSGTTLSDSGVSTFSGRKTQTITSAGKTFSGPITVDSYGGTVELADALNIGANTLTVTNGTFDTKGYAVTAGGLSSSNSNVRAINLGASTVTLSSSPIAFATNTNLTFNAGTSLINCSSFVAAPDGGGATTGVTFYDVSFTSTTAGSLSINGVNTFRNLSVTAPSSSGLTLLQLLANQTITGTFTCSGATSVQRIFVRSPNLGTTRTLTVNSLSAQDCDFRDIEILGAAAGSTPTRAGDCGGNAGITFPAAKTVYWNLAGAQNWSATGWAASSGGTPNINNFPLAQDTAVFDNTGSVTGTITINAAWNIGTFNASARTSAMTFTVGTTLPFVHGNWLFGTGVTQTSTTGTITFAGRGTQTITSNGVSFGCPITVNGVTGTAQLADALTLGSTRTLTLTSGTFDAVSYNVTMGLFADSGTLPRTLKMGFGTWTLSGVGNVWIINNTTNFNFYKSSADIVVSDNTTSARAFLGNGLSYNKLIIGGATSTSTFTFTSSMQFTEIASTKTVAHTIVFGSTTQAFGKWSVTGTAGNVVTVSGNGGIVILGSRVSGVDYLAMGIIFVTDTSPGEFYSGANSTGSNANIIKTAAPAAVTRYWVGGTGTWDDTTTTKWSASSGGAGGASVPTSADAVVFDTLSNATAYTVTCTATQLRCGSLTMAGPFTGNVTWAGTAPLAIHDNVSLAATGITRSYTGNITLTGSTTGRTLTTNGVVVPSSVIVDGVNCGWVLESAFSGSVITLTNGSFDTASYAVAFSRFSSSSSRDNSRSLTLGSSTLTATAEGFQNSSNAGLNLTVNAGTSQFNVVSSGPTFGNLGGAVGFSFYNVTFTNTSAGVVDIRGVNTFNNLSFTGITAAGLKVVSLAANQTVNGTLTLSAGTNATMRHFVQSNTIGTTRTLTCAAVTATDADFRDITIAGAAAPASGTRLGDCKGNSGITFPVAKTVYWRDTGGNNWGGGFGVWSATPGGTADANLFPLAQDTAAFPSATYPASGQTVAINAAYNIGTIDMSARTTNTITLATGGQAPTIYGNWINGTGTTLTGIGLLTIAGRGTQTITSAGKSFTQPITVTTPGGSVTLQDAFNSTQGGSQTIFLGAGTFNANGYNVTSNGGFSATGTFVRTMAFGSGTWTTSLDGGSAFNFGTSTNLTVTGTGTISLTSALAKTFTGGGVSYSGITLNQGGAGALTISNNNTFGNITNTYKATGATTIALGTTTQRVGAFGASGEVGRVLTVTGASATSPAALVFTGAGQATTPTTDYLTITGVRAYSLDTTWYAGANSTNNGSLGWYFEAGGGGAVTAFIIETITAADLLSSLASFGIGVSETITALEAQAAGLVCLGTLSELATAADVAAAFQAYSGQIAEAATAADLIAASLTLNAAISELTTGSEQVAAVFAFSASVSELVAAADNVSGSLLFLSNISEATTAVEIVTATAIFNQAIAEATTASDVLVAIAALNAVVPESVSGSDVAQAFRTVGGSISESLAALDELVALFTLNREISESAGAQDSSTNVYTANPSIDEAAQSADAALVAPSTFGAIALAVAEAIDSISPAGSVYNVTLPVESAGITDFLVGAYLWNPIDDTQTANWQNVSSGQNPGWTQIPDTQAPGWFQIPTAND